MKRRERVTLLLDDSFVLEMSRWVAVQKMHPIRPGEHPVAYLRRVARIVDEAWPDA